RTVGCCRSILYEWRMSVERSKQTCTLAAALVTALFAGTCARSAELFTAPDYKACVAKISAHPDDALESALYWRDHGGGLAAEHCAALAELALNQPGQAALRLDAMAKSPDAGSLANRAELLDQAGNAWLLAQQGANAEAVLSAALRMTPRD